jgi:predicted phage tail protein
MSAAAVAAAKAAFLGTFTIGGTTFSTLGVIASTLFSQGLSLLAQGVLSMVMGQSPQAIAEKNQRIEEHLHTGGSTQSTQVRSRSFLFSNDKNVGTQGNRIPIGYGRFTTSSNVIFVSLKDYDTNSSFQEQVKLNSEIEFN